MLVALGNNSFSGPLSCSLDGDASVLDLALTSFQCPLPALPGSSVMIGGECRHDVVQILIYAGALAGAFGFFGLVYVLSLRQRSLAFKLVRFSAMFAFGVVDIVSDIRLNLNMLEYVSNRPACSVFTDKSFFQDILPVSNLAPDSSFATFAEYVSEVEGNGLIIGSDLIIENIEFIDGLCSRVKSDAAPLCKFSKERNVCEDTTVELPFAYFREWVIVVCVLYGIKELAKVAAILCLCARRRKKPCPCYGTGDERGGEARKSGRQGSDYRLGVFVNKSVLAPCLVAALGFQDFEELVLGDATEGDTWLELLYEVRNILWRLLVCFQIRHWRDSYLVCSGSHGEFPSAGSVVGLCASDHQEELRLLGTGRAISLSLFGFQGSVVCPISLLVDVRVYICVCFFGFRFPSP